MSDPIARALILGITVWDFRLPMPIKLSHTANRSASPQIAFCSMKTLRGFYDLLRGNGPLTVSGSDTSPAAPFMAIFQRPFTFKVSWNWKHAKPTSPFIRLIGSSRCICSGSPPSGGETSMTTRRSAPPVSPCVNTTMSNFATRSRSTLYLDMTPPCTSSLLATAAVFSARNAPVILMLPSMGEHWCAVAGLDQLIGTRRYVHPRDRTTSGGFASRGTCRARCHAFSRNWMNLCYSPKTGRWAGE
jgi:hypothetical protein